MRRKEAVSVDLARLVADRAERLGFGACETRAAAEVSRDDQAWRTRESLSWCPEAVGLLEARGVLCGWDECPDGPAVTFTPWGAAVLGLAVVERWERVEAEAEAGAVKKPACVGYLEVPEWDDAGRAAHRPPLSPPRYAREVPLVRPNAVADEKAGPDYLVDEVSGEPVRLWGQAVARDKRVKGKR